jgi:small subunit ribosomal protein S1
MTDLNQIKNQNFENSEVDENWWAAVLSDEESEFSEQTEINCKPCGNRQVEGIDWECIRSIFMRDEVILMEVTGFNRGGLLVQREGIQGFVPISHLLDFSTENSDEEKQEKLANYVGKSLYLKIIECEASNERVVLSERAAQAGEGKRKELFSVLSPGVTACGLITNITDFGAFVDLGGVEGLIHVSEISWGRVENPATILKIGQQVKVIVLQVNETTSRIALSIKRLSPNPWETLVNTYKPGDVVAAELTSIMRFGVFARLAEGIEGLIHISSLPECQRNRDISLFYSPGQQVQVRILHMDAERRRLGLGLVIDE